MILSSYYRQSKIVYLELLFFQQFFSVAELYTKNLRFILGRFGGGYFGLKKYNTANEMDEAWEICPFFSNGDFFFSYENKAVCLNGAGKGSRKRKGLKDSGLSCDTIYLYFLSLRDS